MYSLVFVIPTGIIIRDSKVGYYTCVLSFFGSLVALYHNLIYYNIIKEGMKVCTADLSCKSRQLEIMGFVTIPMMSLLAFLIIFILSTRSLKSESH
jgi:disulfide bond formation protein DsbB